MPAIVAGLRYPVSRVLLPRTRLAYVHLRNLLTDAKRDRAARVSGYVAVWLPEEFLVLYLLQGELVNAVGHDGSDFRALPIARALERIPTEPEYGEICFHEAEPELLAAMYRAQTEPCDPWPPELRPSDPRVLFPYLMATTFDGVMELSCGEGASYLVLQHGAVERAFLSGGGEGTAAERLAAIFAGAGARGDRLSVRRWAGQAALPVQAPPALVQAYRELVTSLVRRLVTEGRTSAPVVAEHARRSLLSLHPPLDAFAFDGSSGREPVADSASLTAAVAALVRETLWAAADPSDAPPETLLKELTWERRHVFQAAGFYERLPWRVT